VQGRQRIWRKEFYKADLGGGHVVELMTLFLSSSILSPCICLGSGVSCRDFKNLARLSRVVGS
jgi:hypothetical protein